MHIVGWREPLDRALERNRSQPHSRYFQLATVRTDGLRVPRRHGQPWGENCWYFTETGEQFPMADRLTPMGASHPDPVFQTARSTWWQDLSHKAGQQFLWPHASTARSNADAFLPLAVSISSWTKLIAQSLQNLLY